VLRDGQPAALRVSWWTIFGDIAVSARCQASAARHP